MRSAELLRMVSRTVVDPDYWQHGVLLLGSFR